MRIKTISRQVFLGGRCAWFTKKAAYRAEAKYRIAQKYPCQCEKPEYDAMTMIYPGMTCDRHLWPKEKYFRLVNRLARFLQFLDWRKIT